MEYDWFTFHCYSVIRNETYASITGTEQALHHVMISDVEQDLYLVQNRFFHWGEKLPVSQSAQLESENMPLSKVPLGLLMFWPEYFVVAYCSFSWLDIRNSKGDVACNVLRHVQYLPLVDVMKTGVLPRIL